MLQSNEYAGSGEPEPRPSPPVGLIGLGLMGEALAERFLATGRAVLGYDVRQGRREALRRLGIETADRAEELADRCPRIVLSLPGSPEVRSVTDGLAATLRPGQIVLDTTTGDPEVAAEVGRRFGDRGVAYLDATISGSNAQVRAAEAVVIAGGSAEAFASCRDLFEAFAREAHRVGPCGSGSKLKLVSNLILGLNRAALAEGLSLARAWGLDPERTLAVLRGSAAASRAMEAKGEKMIAGDFAPQARLSQHRKDVRLILEAADRIGRDLPLSRVHDRLLELAEAAGLGELDNSAIIRAFDLLSRSATAAESPGPKDCVQPGPNA